MAEFIETPKFLIMLMNYRIYLMSSLKSYAI